MGLFGFQKRKAAGTINPNVPGSKKVGGQFDAVTRLEANGVFLDRNAEVQHVKQQRGSRYDVAEILRKDGVWCDPAIADVLVQHEFFSAEKPVQGIRTFLKQHLPGAHEVVFSENGIGILDIEGRDIEYDDDAPFLQPLENELADCEESLMRIARFKESPVYFHNNEYHLELIEQDGDKADSPDTEAYRHARARWANSEIVRESRRENSLGRAWDISAETMHLYPLRRPHEVQNRATFDPDVQISSSGQGPMSHPGRTGVSKETLMRRDNSRTGHHFVARRPDESFPMALADEATDTAHPTGSASDWRSESNISRTPPVDTNDPEPNW